MILGKNLYQGGVLYIYACANPAETVQLMSVICIDSTNREVSLIEYRQALFGSRKVCTLATTSRWAKVLQTMEHVDV